ncbi:MAG TPA: alpha/beta hydrolase [bacterium (Candidatus Stahlbacteria)]|nr:alpha/beta hydrolase [Candidatus Stahlbacteria bacterium]
MIRILLIILLLIGLIYIGLLLLFFFTQDRFVYFPNLPGREIRQTPRDIGLDYEDIEITTQDRVKIHGWFIPAADEREVLLFCHGNAGNISHRLESIRIFHDLGLSVLIFDYRGYGQSGGRISEQGSYLDGKAVWRFLIKDKGTSPARIILFGRSVGTGVACWLAVQEKPAALILESPFTSIPDLGQELYPYFPVRILCRIRYENLKSISKVSCPILIIHSQDDEIVPIRHGERLFEAANEPKQFLKIRGSHDDGFAVSLDEYTKGLDRFITRYVDDENRIAR